jgi:hypothetical protein
MTTYPNLYRKKPVLIEAVQWNPDRPEPVVDWLTAHGCHFQILDGGRLGVGTLESGDGLDRHAGDPGCWVIRGIKGEFYVCRQDVFEESYEPEPWVVRGINGEPSISDGAAFAETYEPAGEPS